MQNVYPSVLRHPAQTSFTVARLFATALFTAAVGIMAPLGSIAFAQSDHADPHCTKVGGAFVTNFTAPDQTAGTATGDLKGAVGVKILATVSGIVGNGKPVTLKVQHFWVTESGDTLFAAPAEITAYPGTSPSQPLVYSFVYEQGVSITGGTGKFNGATMQLKTWGAVDLGGTGEVVGRYSGSLCFKAPSQP